jgi:hypothetical protein
MQLAEQTSLKKVNRKVSKSSRLPGPKAETNGRKEYPENSRELYRLIFSVTRDESYKYMPRSVAVQPDDEIQRTNRCDQKAIRMRRRLAGTTSFPECFLVKRWRSVARSVGFVRNKHPEDAC